MRTFLIVLALLLSSPAFAQAGICKAGAKCSVRLLKTTAGSASQAPLCLTNNGGSYSQGLVATGALVFNWRLYSDFECQTAAADILSYDVGASTMSSIGRITTPNGTASLPAYSIASDPNTGLYSIGADQLGVTTNGARSFNFSATSGRLEGVTAAPALVLDNSLGAALTYNSTTIIRAATQAIVLTPNGPGGVTLQSAGPPTAWSLGSEQEHTDSFSGRFYWNTTAPSAVAPAIDFGGGQHPVMQRRVYGLEMGFESNATPTFYPATPRVGGAAATVTPVDASGAGTVAIGSNPSTYDSRTSVTLASVGSISSMVTSAFIRRATQSPRWCQKVSMSTTANIRVWLGFANALPGSTDNPSNGGQSFRYSSAVDTAWQACFANGVSTTCTSTGVAPSSGTTTFDTLCIDCIEGGTTACTWWVNGVARFRQTTGLGAGYGMFPFYSVEARAAAAVTLYPSNSSVELY